MPIRHSKSLTVNLEAGRDVDSGDIEVRAQGNRRALEAVYVELRELAKQHDLHVEFEPVIPDSPSTQRIE